MARIEDEIGKIADPVLRATLFDEVKKLKTEKRFGLVFEEHLPELVPVYGAKVKARTLVARRGRTFTETFQVVRVHEGIAEVEKNDGSRENILVDELTVVRRFGEPIYPALRTFDRVRNGDTSQPHHILIEADNYHALQLLEYCYSGKVDCIYIDPPYNTGAKDWKYNNDYVDGNDTWRHSKWLSMMRKRLILAKRLLKKDGVLAIAIDDNEMAHLVCLLENKDIFDDFDRTIVTMVHNPRGNITNNFARIHEYIIYLTPKSGQLLARSIVDNETPRKLRRWGHYSRREERRSMFYPIYVHNNKVIRIGAQPPDEFHPSGRNVDVGDGVIEVWPIDQHGVERRWNYAHSEIHSHFQRIIALPKDQGIDLFLASELSPPKTVWSAPELDAGGVYGSSFVESVVKNKFPYPKSLYGVLKSIEPVIIERPDALIVDFFAGSGTTLNAVNLINSKDNGNRQCILVTNNEVSEEESTRLTNQGCKPGTDEWNQHGICQSVTFSRSKYTMLGRRDDGSELEGEYLTGRMATKEKPRTFKQLGFTEGRLLSLAQRKQLVALIDKVPQSKITADMPFFVDDEIPASILFDIRQAEAWLEALEDQEHITDFYLVTQENRAFTSIKQQVQELLGPVLMEEEEKRPLKDGFPANLEYFKLDFLDPAEVQMGRQFAAILPVLWMMAGARGPLPDAPDPHAPWLIPADCPFAVLIQEKRFKEFYRHIEGRDDLTHVFIVTNSASTYHNLREEIEVPHVVQLYKDYLQNFKINYGKD